MCVDAERDLRDIGAQGLQIANITKLPYGKIESTRCKDYPKGFKEGVIFSTYSALLGTSAGKRRLDSLVQWLGGKSAEGCVLFDEAHKAKGAAHDQPVGKAVVRLQRGLRNARVVYLSATVRDWVCGLSPCSPCLSPCSPIGPPD